MIEEIKNYKDLLKKVKSNVLDKSSEQGNGKNYLTKAKEKLNSNNSSFMKNILKGNFFTPAVIWKLASFTFGQLGKRPKTVLKVGKYALYAFLFLKARSIWKFLKK